MKTREEAKKMRRAVRVLERVARAYADVAEACREWEELDVFKTGGPSAWARPDREEALKRAAQAATMAGILREALEGDADEKARRPGRAAGERQITPAKGRICKAEIYGEGAEKASGKSGGAKRGGVRAWQPGNGKKDGRRK